MIHKQWSKQYLSIGTKQQSAVTTPPSVSDPPSTLTRPPLPSSNQDMKVAHSRLTRATSTIKESLLGDTTTRILPPELIEAHNNAVNSFGKSLEETQEILQQTSEKKRTQRLTKIHSQRSPQTINDHDNTGGTSPTRRQPQSSVETLSTDELMTSLLLELKEERGKIKREIDRQAFDSIWG